MVHLSKLQIINFGAILLTKLQTLFVYQQFYPNVFFSFQVLTLYATLLLVTMSPQSFIVLRIDSRVFALFYGFKSNAIFGDGSSFRLAPVSFRHVLIFFLLEYLLVFYFMGIFLFVYPFIRWWAFLLLSLFGFMNNSCVYLLTSVCVDMGMYFLFLLGRSRSGTGVMFNFLINCQTCLPK